VYDGAAYYSIIISAIGLFVWLVAGAGLFREKSTVDWLLVADLF
jgi:hypothetical protein